MPVPKKGNRPSYIKAAKPDVAIPLYEKFIEKLQLDLGKPIQTGQFGADMKVQLTNDGPVTIIIDSKQRDLVIIKNNLNQKIYFESLRNIIAVSYNLQK